MLRSGSIADGGDRHLVAQLDSRLSVVAAPFRGRADICGQIERPAGSEAGDPVALP